MAAAAGLGCATPEQKQRVLRFFFDGVPSLEPLVLPDESGDDPASPDAEVKQGSVHGPYAGKACDRCHESKFSNSLKLEKEELCWSCHESEDILAAVVHSPVAAGQCVACHDPHRSKNPFLLVMPTIELCEHCHDQGTFPRIDEHRAQRGGDCTRCHDPHATSREYMLKSDADVL